MIVDKIKLKNPYKVNILFCIANLIYFLPISIIIGNMFLNINVLLIDALFIYLFFKEKIFIKYKKFFFCFLIFTSLLLVNIYFSVNYSLSSKAASGLLRYYILFFAIYYCLENSKNFENNFSKVCFVVICFVLFDTLLQYFTGKDLFNYEINTSHGNRLSGPFGDEYIVGSFISKIIFFSLLFISNIKKHFLLASIFLFLGLFVTILSNERAASIMLLISIVIFFVFYNPQNNLKFFFIFIVILSTILLVKKNKSIHNHFYTIVKKHYADNHWKAHFLTSIEIFKNNKFLGSGIKTFKVECSNPEHANINSKYSDNRCANHPHNIYFEVLSDGGLLFFIFFVTLNLFIGLSYFLMLCNNKNNIKQLFIFCSFFILYWPLQTTGSIFSTWNGIFYWISLAFILKKNN